MEVFFRWFLVLAISIFTTLCLSGPVFYQKKKVELGDLSILGSDFGSVWTFRLAFYCAALIIYVPMTMLIYWLYDRTEWFAGRWWVISLTLLLADRISSTFLIWYFKNELPDMWMVWGMVSLLFCMTMSTLTRG